MRALELFAGAGGLAMGVSKAGFSHSKVVEWDEDCCATLEYNKGRAVRPVSAWSIHRGDVRAFDYSSLAHPVDLVAGGPPCQPFSLGGKHKGYDDHRDMFPEAVRAVRELRPRAFIFENVRGLLRESFSEYFEYIVLQLSYPEVKAQPKGDWTSHLAALEKYHTKGKRDGLRYHVVFRLLNAADYGVPQKRERVFIVGFRADQQIEWSFPEPTHSREALLASKWADGTYWEKHRVPRTRRGVKPVMTQLSLHDGLGRSRCLPWKTVRDALDDLPDPKKTNGGGPPNHVFMPGARPYPGHTGCVLDEPAKTLKAGDHGVPGGENMVLLDDGELRYFTVRESARLQCFPDD